MKVKFTKLAALLLAGAALYATGCTDYEVDIQKVDKRVTDLENGKVASLESQLSTLKSTLETDYETIANHNKDVENINKDIKALQDFNNVDLPKLLDKKLDKATYNEFQATIAAAKAKLTGLEYASEDFVNQVADLLVKLQNQANSNKDNIEAITKEGGLLDQTYAKAKEYTDGEIGRLEGRLGKAEKAIEDLTKEPDGVIPQIKKQIADLESNKLNKSDFDEYYKAAYDKYTKETIRLITANIEALQALTAGFPEDKTIKEYIDDVAKRLDDYVLTTTFEKFTALVGTKEELESMEGTVIGRMKALEALTAGFPENTTIKAYVDDEAKKLQNQLDLLTNAEKTGRIDVLEATAEEYTKKVDDLISLTSFANGDLQGYIDTAAQEAFDEACSYADDLNTKTRAYVKERLAFIYDILNTMLSRIQSIVYVPDYDDLKITTNISAIKTSVLDESGEEKEVYEMVDQPFQVKYKITPARYAPYVTDYLYFDVKTLNTRADEAEDGEEPWIGILDVVSADEETGEITLLVQGFNIASQSYAANANRPQFDVELRAGGVPGRRDGDHIWGTDGVIRGTVGMDRLEGYNYTWSIPVWNIDELKAYQARSAFAAALQLYNVDVLNLDYDSESGEVTAPLYTGDLEDLVLKDLYYENEISSSYNVLYPDLSVYEIPNDPYKKIDDPEDPDGNPTVRLFTAEEQHQTLPYNTLRKSDEELATLKGELSDEEFAAVDPGYRVILEDAVPAVIIDGQAYGLFPEDVYYWEEPEDESDFGFHIIYTSEDADPILIPEVRISDSAAIEYIKGETSASEPKKENYKINGEEAAEEGDTYAEVEMNGEKAASARKYEIGNLVKGTYTFTSQYGAFTAYGDVLITKELGAIDVFADAVWTWNWNKSDVAQAENLGDALVDHNIFYGTEDGPTTYVRTGWEISIDEKGADKLDKDLGVGLVDFNEVLDPDGENFYTIEKIEVADRLVDEDGNEVAVDELEFSDLPEDSEFAIENVTITEDSKLVADFLNFDWDKVYRITVKCELDVATITVTGIFKTIDRNREPVTVDLYSYTFDINKMDEETGNGYDNDKKYYAWTGEAMTDRIFKAFDNDHVINVLEPVDFVYADDEEDFFNSELKGKIKHGNGEGIDGEPEDIYDYLKVRSSSLEPYTHTTFTAAKLKEYNSSKQSDDDPYVFLGDTLWRYFTTYIGEVVKVPFQFNYRVPAYDFLHQSNYTFKKDAAEGENGHWYTMASPKYDYNKSSLWHYDVQYMNVPALAFNIIDKDNRFFEYQDKTNDDMYFYDDSLFVNFYYTGPDTVDETLLEEQSATDDLKKYGDLWFTPENAPDGAVTAVADNFEHTVFYYRSPRPEIPMYGTLAIRCDKVDFEIPTSFEKDNNGKYLAKQDYSDFEIRQWKPFYVPTYEQNLYIDLDEHVMYNANVLEGLQFFDARQVRASSAVDEIQDPFVEGTYSIDGFNAGVKCYFRPMLGWNAAPNSPAAGSDKVWGWIVGNADQGGNSTIEGEAANGYAAQTPDRIGGPATSWTAYDLQMKHFVFDDRSDVPADLRAMIKVNKDTYNVSVDYRSEVEFRNTAKISFTFDFQTPWQFFDDKFTVNVIVRGLDQQ